MSGVSFPPEGWRDLPCLPFRFHLHLFFADPWAPGAPRTSGESILSSPGVTRAPGNILLPQHRAAVPARLQDGTCSCVPQLPRPPSLSSPPPAAALPWADPCLGIQHIPNIQVGVRPCAGGGQWVWRVTHVGGLCPGYSLWGLGGGSPGPGPPHGAGPAVGMLGGPHQTGARI